MVKLTRILPPLLSSAAKNVYISLFFKVCTSLMFLVLIPYSIRHMGAEKYGIAAFFLTMHGYVSLLDSGFTYALGLNYTRALTIDSDEAARVFASAFPIYGILAVFAVAVFSLFKNKLSTLAFGTEIYSFEMCIFGFVLAISAVDSMLVSVIQAHEKIYLIATGRFLLDLLKVGGVTMMALTGLEPGRLVWFILFSVVTKFIFDFYYFRKLMPKLIFRIEKKIMNKILLLAIPSVAIAMCSLFLSMADKFLVSGKISASAFTSYSFAMDITTKAYFLMYAVSSVVYPKMIKSNSANQSSTRFIKIQLVALMGIIGIFYLPLAVFSDFITVTLLGPSFLNPTSNLIKLCAFSAVLYLVFSIIESYFNALGAVKKSLSLYIVGIFVFTTLLSFWFERYQVYGAVISVIGMYCAMIFGGLAMIIFSKYKQQGKHA